MSNLPIFKGCCTALVTPMQTNGAIDFAAVESLINWQIESNIKSLVIAGSTGEAATLEWAEQLELIKFAGKISNKRVPIIAGVGTSSTEDTCQRIKAVSKLDNIDACIVVTPSYNRPTQAGLIAHYTKVSQASDLPIILYNVPARTSCDLLPQTVEKLSKIDNIVGLKEAVNTKQRFQELATFAKSNPEFSIYSGDDPTHVSFMREYGAIGVISVASNVFPKLMVELAELCLHDQSSSKIGELDTHLQKFYQALAFETNPIPAKWALNYLDKIQANIRLPLTWLEEKYNQEFGAIMEDIINFKVKV